MPRRIIGRPSLAWKGRLMSANNVKVKRLNNNINRKKLKEYQDNERD